MTLTEFLLARIADIEALAKQAAETGGGAEWVTETGGGVELVDPDVNAPGDFMVAYGEGRPNPAQALHIACWDPARVLAECEAKRRIVDAAWDQAPGECDECHSRGGDHTLSLLAQVYADHPAYDPTWRP